MNRALIVVIVLALVAAGYLIWRNSAPETDFVKEAEIRIIAENFGQKLKAVPLLADKETVARVMDENYKEFVAPDLLNRWKENPSGAPGRLTSSPWPERIEVGTVTKINDNKYEVSGDIIEVANADTGTKVVARLPVILTIERVDGKWLITKMR
ncbi:hypothetical protein A3B18_02040 [Candidatus Giovannonibacteria bacterium RIFCSPLOWO2_01_FULL_46_13]|uniref:Uncharacterized protein n=1 Tax=Candidatus Giovannonibacteria bacterium RIFCSPLOWO2_01_FULL_46_13 TaxID=1798352 RepID=A0A1F5X640_9BACT|nr:MAG: hypothetical protein A3B18_02040 [Candidatus Giovannonibacteria bacterium RIFCSPLOWO2_01_FULL_46_13]